MSKNINDLSNDNDLGADHRFAHHFNYYGLILIEINDQLRISEYKSAFIRQSATQKRIYSAIGNPKAHLFGNWQPKIRNSPRYLCKI